MADDPIFPTEIFETIVGNLADDLETLRICALVSWTFYSLARLFTRLQVGPRVDQEHSLAKLCELLEISPSFAAGVQSLRLCDKWEHNHPRWITQADLGRCFSLLGSLTCLVIKGFSSYKLVWSKFSVATRDSIHSILPILTCLEVHSVSEFPLALLSQCSLLRSLTLYGVTFAKNSDLVVVAPVPVSCIQLRHLGLHVDASLVGGFLDWITSPYPDSPLDISRLSSLECTVLALEGCLPIQRLLDAFVPSLQHLHIVNYNSLTWHHYNLDLRKLLHLRKLTLDMVIELPRDYQRMLSLRHVPLPLQQKLALVLNLHVEGSHTEAVQGIATVDSAWATLPAIASVMINLWYQRHIEASPRVRKESFVDVSEEFVQRMPLLTNRLADTGELRVLKCIMSSP